MTDFPYSVAGCAQIPPDLVTEYARGSLTGAVTWSVEAHLPACAACRRVLTAELDQPRLLRNRSVLLTRLAMPAPGPAERVAGWCGVPSHVWRLLSMVPSLRRPWLAGVVLVLAASVGSARLLAATDSRAAALLPFLFLTPLLPLAGVAAAFHPSLDPSADLATAAPISGVWLFCVRSVAVIAASLGPIMLAALTLPGSTWLPLMVVLPALALSMLALAMTTIMGPLRAAVIAGAGWLAVVAGIGLAADSPAATYGRTVQALSLIVVIGAAALLAIRRHTLEYRLDQ